jgi:hypothetical protein
MPILDCVDENPSAAESRGSHDETGDNKKIWQQKWHISQQ